MTSSPTPRWPGWLICALFISFAALQLNDPDPWVWTSLYALVALLAALTALQRMSTQMLWTAVGVYTTVAVLYMIPGVRDAWTTWWVPSSTQAQAHADSMSSWGGEEGREIGGLWISTTALIILTLWHRRLQRTSRTLITEP